MVVACSFNTLLIGAPDGESNGEGTVNYLVNRRLQEMAEMAREFQLPLR